MAYDQETVDAVISTLLSSQQVNYQVGDKRFDNGDKIKQAIEARKALAEIPEVSLGFVQFDNDIALSGVDNTQRTVL